MKLPFIPAWGKPEAVPGWLVLARFKARQLMTGLFWFVQRYAAPCCWLATSLLDDENGFRLKKLEIRCTTFLGESGVQWFVEQMRFGAYDHKIGSSQSTATCWSGRDMANAFSDPFLQGIRQFFLSENTIIPRAFCSRCKAWLVEQLQSKAQLRRAIPRKLYSRRPPRKKRVLPGYVHGFSFGHIWTSNFSQVSFRDEDIPEFVWRDGLVTFWLRYFCPHSLRVSSRTCGSRVSYLWISRALLQHLPVPPQTWILGLFVRSDDFLRHLSVMECDAKIVWDVRVLDRASCLICVFLP